MVVRRLQHIVPVLGLFSAFGLNLGCTSGKKDQSLTVDPGVRSQLSGQQTSALPAPQPKMQSPSFVPNRTGGAGVNVQNSFGRTTPMRDIELPPPELASTGSTAASIGAPTLSGTTSSGQPVASAPRGTQLMIANGSGQAIARAPRGIELEMPPTGRVPTEELGEPIVPVKLEAVDVGNKLLAVPQTQPAPVELPPPVPLTIPDSPPAVPIPSSNANNSQPGLPAVIPLPPANSTVPTALDPMIEKPLPLPAMPTSTSNKLPPIPTDLPPQSSQVVPLPSATDGQLPGLWVTPPLPPTEPIRPR